MKRHIRGRPIIITAALTGAGYSATKYPNLPLSVEDVRKDAVSTATAGARAIHYHARNPATGSQFSDPEHYRKVRQELNQNLSGIPLSFASSRKGETEKDIERELRRLAGLNPDGSQTIKNLVQAEMIRAGGIEAMPDRFTTFTPPEILLAGEVAHFGLRSCNRDLLGAHKDLMERSAGNAGLLSHPCGPCPLPACE